MPLEYVIRIETNNEDPRAWKNFYCYIHKYLSQFITMPFSIHDYGDYICEQFEQSPNEIKNNNKGH